MVVALLAPLAMAAMMVYDAGLRGHGASLPLCVAAVCSLSMMGDVHADPHDATITFRWPFCGLLTSVCAKRGSGVSGR